MIGNIITAIITGGLALLGVVLSNNAAADKTQAKISTAQAVTDTKLDELKLKIGSACAVGLLTDDEQLELITSMPEPTATPAAQ